MSQALVEARLNPENNPIRTATHGIAFFGTPHQGSGLSNVGEVVAKIVRTTLRKPPNSLLESLKKNSDFLTKLTGDFKHQYEDYKILSVYERVPVKGLNKVSVTGLSFRFSVQ
jgi:hypothetical protein